MNLFINTDGGSRGNPGPAATGVVIKNANGDVVKAWGTYIGETTNNVAEYTALVEALTQAHLLGGSNLEIRMDSELIVRQMQGVYKIKEPRLQQLASEVLRLLKAFSGYEFKHVRREYNKEADAMVNTAIDKALGLKK